MLAPSTLMSGRRKNRARKRTATMPRASGKRRRERNAFIGGAACKAASAPVPPLPAESGERERGQRAHLTGCTVHDVAPPTTTTLLGSYATLTSPAAAGGASAITCSAVPSASVTANRVTGPRYSTAP